jgi:DNA-binding IclR family transcriptional regulator
MALQGEGVAGAQTIRRAVALLRAIARGTPAGRRLKDLAAAVDLAQPTTHRIIRAMMDEDLVAQDPATRLYRIGRLTFELGLAGGRYQTELIEGCRPHLRQLAAQTGDTCYLSIRSGVDTVCLDRAEGSYPIRAMTVEVGGRLPLGAGTGGVALLSAMSDADVEQVLAAVARDYPAYNNLTVDEVRERVRRTRQSGYVDIKDKPVPGVRGVGLAVPAGDALPHLCLAVAAVQGRIPDKRVAEIRALLTEAATRIAAITAPNRVG